MGEGPFTWQVRITRQKTDNSLRPAIFSMPGAGEVGTSLANLVAYGPHYWMQNGWDGGIKLGNGIHYPIIITVEQPVNNMRPWHLKAVLEILLNTFPIKRNSVHVAGLSQGSYEWGELIGFAASAGDETAMSEIKSWVDLEGVGPGDNFLGFDPPFPQAYQTWVKKYGGKFFGLEGTNDSRNVWQLSQAMNSASAGSAYFSYQNIGGGTHCCWNSMYDPSVTNWTCVGTPGNPNVVPSTNPASTMGTYFYSATTGSNIFQWMLRQGDTSMVGASTPPSTAPTVSAGSNQAVQLPSNSINLTGVVTPASGHTIASTVWSWTSGPSTYTISTPNSLATAVTGLVAGTYVFTLTATDDAGQISTSTVTVAVNAVAPPTVNAGSAISITLPTSSVNLSGTATANGGGTISSTQWTVTGPNTPVIVAASSLTTQVTGLVQGTYTFTLKATDNSGNTSTSTVNVVVNAASSTPPTTAPQTLVATGEYQVFFIDKNKKLYSIGTNLRTIGTNGGGVAGAINPVSVPSNLTFISAASGLHGGAAIDNNGNVWSWGDNSQGQVGIGTVTTTEVLMPTMVDKDVNGNAFGNVASLCAFFSGNTSQGMYAIKNDGTLWVWGQTLGGMQGDGTAGTTNLTRPKQIVIPGGRLAKQVSAGNHTILLCTDGTVWTFGGSGGNPQNLGYLVSGTSYYTPTQLTGLSNIVQVSGGGGWNYALNASGTLYGWGYYGYYMGGTGGTNTPMPTPTDLTTRLNLPHPVKTIVSNMTCTHVILTDGTLWGWGDNAQGTIGIGKELDFSKTTYPYAWDWNAGDLLQQSPVQVTNRNDFVALFSTQPFVMFTYAETADGQLYSWGRNKSAVLGNGVVSCSPDVAASYPNSWDVVTATPVNPLAQTTATVVPSPYCLANPTTAPCNACSLGVFPVANAGAATTISLPTNSAILDGSASTSPDGSALTYTWTLKTGPSSYTISSPASAKTPVTGLVQGVYTFLLTVKNASGNTSTATVTVTVNPPASVTPVANAGSNTSITLPTNSVNLDGSASSTPDGTSLTYAWSLQSGPTSYTITSPTAAKTSVTGLTQGTYIFLLTVKNGSGVSATATVTITVNPAPVVIPVANAGSAISITLPTNSVSLDGSASSSPDGSALTYAWSLQSGPSSYTITSPTAAKTGVTGLVQGTYKFQLTVKNSGGNSATATVIVTVNPAAVVIPVANAGSDVSITLPTSSVSLDGSASSSPDGSALTYSWTYVSGPAGYTITSPAAASTTVTGLAQGTYVFQLTVKNSSGNTATDQVTVTVNSAAAVIPVANAGAAISITLPTNSVTLDGSASSSPDGSALTYAWSYVSGPAAYTIASPAAAKTSVTGLVQGTYKFQLTVKNSSGNSATATVTVTVNPAPVVIPVANAGSNISITLPVNSVNLDGSASSSPDGSALTYAWSEQSGPATYTIASPAGAKTSVTGLVQGTYTFQLTVKNGQGNSSTATVTVTVNAAPVIIPVANAGTALSITLPTSSVTLDGSASSSPDGSALTYSWSYVSGPAAYTIAGPAAAKTSVTGLVKGTYVFLLKVTNSQGNTASASVTVTVNPMPVITPVANAGSNITITLPTNSVTLDGSASSSPDGSALTYSWSYVSGPAGYTIASPGTAKTNVTGLSQGTYAFQLQVSNPSGGTATAMVYVYVNNPDVAPIANAGNDTTITLPVNSVKLDGTKSYDPDGSVVSYNWFMSSGASGVTIVNANTSTPTVVGLPSAGRYTFVLTVMDNAGLTGSASVTVTLNAGSGTGGPGNGATLTANAGKDTVAALPVSNLALDGSGSSDVGGTIISYAWSQLSGPVGSVLKSANSAVCPVDGLQKGNYVFRLTVTDDHGNVSMDTVTVSVIATNRSSEKDDLNIFPNPAQAITNLGVTSGTEGQMQINVVSTSGSVVMSTLTQKTLPYQVVSLDVSGLSRGTYIVEILIGNGQTRIVKKLVKQ
jgi:alpha-tubulin suppressor-like RCC1 family protein